MTSAPSEEHARLNRLASARMECGIALLNGGSPDALQEAIRCFDEAIEIRQRLPLAGHPGFRYCVAAGWINRGDALTRLGAPKNLDDAVTSYSTAIELLKDAPPGEDGSFLKRLAVAWMNRGIALEAQASEPAFADAVHSYKEAIRLLSCSRRAAGGNLNLLLASAWINLANISLRLPGGTHAAETCAAAEHALSLLAETELHDFAAAEAALKARHILCQAITLLGETSHDLDLVNKLTDAVESALDLVQVWEKAGVTSFRLQATQFFQFGALVYEKHQSHFLAEFLMDYLELESVSSPSMNAAWLAIAAESLSRMRTVLRNCDFASLATPQGIRRLEILAEAQAAEERFKTLLPSTPSNFSCT